MTETIDENNAIRDRVSVGRIAKTTKTIVLLLVATVVIMLGSVWVFSFYLGATGNSVAGSVMALPFVYVVFVSAWNSIVGDGDDK